MNKALIKVTETTILEGLLASFILCISIIRGNSHGFSEEFEVIFVDLVEFFEQPLFLFVFLFRVQLLLIFRGLLIHVDFTSVVPPFSYPEVTLLTFFLMANIFNV